MAWSGHPLGAYDRREDARRLIATQGLTTIIIADPPADNAPAATVSGMYGLAFYAVHCLATKYGQPAMLAFFADAVLDNKSYVQAAQDNFHQSFDRVDTECVAYIRSHAR